MESELHKKLKDKAYWYLWNKGYWILKKETRTDWRIVDVWGMKSAFVLSTMAVEVKVSRSDWRAGKAKEMQIDRWDNPPAEENYILCPAELIQPEELEESIGLLWYQNGRLVNKKKAKFKLMTDKKKLKILIQFLESKPFK